MKYQIGDVVRICDDLIIGGYYGRAMIKLTYDMAQSRGTVGEITDVSEEEDAVKVNGWWWSTTMIEAPQQEQQAPSVALDGATAPLTPSASLRSAAFSAAASVAASACGRDSHREPAAPEGEPCDAAPAVQLEELTQIIGAFSGYDPGKRLEEQLARHLFENGVRVQKEADA